MSHQKQNQNQNRVSPPESEAELTARCQAIAGLSISALATQMGVRIPDIPLQRKGLVGALIEHALGTTAGTKALPDFDGLGIELKTLPLGPRGVPQESTFVTSINLLNIHQEVWENSQCFSKLKRVLWVPIEGDKAIPFHHRRIGLGFIWSLEGEQADIIKADWQQLSFMLGAGQLEAVDARIGQYLQVRPKAANSRALCYGFDEHGNKIQTLPRGFYLRAQFTQKVMEQNGRGT